MKISAAVLAESFGMEKTKREKNYPAASPIQIKGERSKSDQKDDFVK